MSEKLCYKCGSVLPHGCEYCPNCGAPAPLSDDEINRKAIIGHGVIVPPRGQSMADIREPATVAVPPPPPPPPLFADMNPDMPVDATDAVVHGPEAVAAEDATRLLTQEDILAKNANPACAGSMGISETGTICSLPGTATGHKPASAAVKKPSEPKPRRKASMKPWGCIAIVSVLILALLAYIFIYSPADSDSDARYMYPIVDTQLRQSATDAGSGNVITDIPFGAKVEVLEKTPEWAHVKYTPASGEGKLEGYMAAPALIEEADFGLLCSILPGERERRQIGMPHQRQALINYYRSHGMAHDPEPESDSRMAIEVPERWIYRIGEYPGKETFVEDYFYGGGAYPDMAVMLTNNRTNAKIVIVYSFDDQGQPVFRYEHQCRPTAVYGIQSIVVDSATGRPVIICN